MNSKAKYRAGKAGAQPAPNIAVFKAYDPKAFTLIPLHKPRATRTMDRKGVSVTVQMGKRPLHPNWTTAPYNTAKVITEAEAAKRNVGVRLRPTQLVIDVDPRHGGDDGFESLCFDIGLRPQDFPCVTTGSGGAHVYMTIEPGTKVLDTIPEYPGVEFKSAGRQVLAAGCIHPDTGKAYTFTPGHPPINTAVRAPKALLRLITRPERPASVGGGHVSPERLARALEALDPTDFPTNDTWMALMMACHHATGGDGRSEFIEWSTSDPQYSDVGEEIGRRWDSCHADRDDGFTAATLNMQLKKAGAAMLPIRSAKEWFGSDVFLPEDETPLEWPRNEAWFKKWKGARHA